MGQVARSMNPPQGNMCDDTVRSSDTSTISSSGENSSTHSPDSTSNTIMLMDKYTHITPSKNFMDSLSPYDCNKRQGMDSTGKDDDDACLQTVQASDRDSGNMSLEHWNEYRPGLRHYPCLQSKIISPLPGIFHSLQPRNTDAQPLSATTDKRTALRTQSDMPFDGDKNDDTVRAIHTAIDELAAMMNTHSLLADRAEEHITKHSRKGNPTVTTSSSMDSIIPTSSTSESTRISFNKPAPLSIDHIPPPCSTTATIPSGFKFSFASNPPPPHESTTGDDQRIGTNDPSTSIHQRKILPLPKPRVQRTQIPPSTTPMSSEFTFKMPYNSSTHSTISEKGTDSNKVFATKTPQYVYGMNHQTNDETPQDYTKKAKRSGECYTDDDDDDSNSGLVHRTGNRYNKATGSSTYASSATDRNRSFDSQLHSFLPPTLLQNSFLNPSSTSNSGSSKLPPSIPDLQHDTASKPPPSPHNNKKKPSLSPPPHSNKKSNSKNKSAASASASSSHTSKRNNSNNNNSRTDINRNTRGKQHGKQQRGKHQQLLSPSSSSASTGKMTSTSRRKGKQGPTDDIQHPYRFGGKNDNNLDLVTSTLVGPDDWICLFCQYEIFKKGWFNAKRKLLVQEQRKRVVQNRLEHRSTLQQQDSTLEQPPKRQQGKDNQYDSG